MWEPPQVVQVLLVVLERSVINPRDKTTQLTQTTITTQGQHGTAVETHTQLIFRTSIIRTTTQTDTNIRITMSSTRALITYTMLPFRPMLTATTLLTIQHISLLITSHTVEA